MFKQFFAVQRDLDRYMRIPGVTDDKELMQMYRKFKVENGLIKSSQALPINASNQPSSSSDFQGSKGDSGCEKRLQINRDIFKHIYDYRFVLLGANTVNDAEVVICAFMPVPRQNYEQLIKEYIKQFVQGGRVFVGIGLTVQNIKVNLKELCMVAEYMGKVGVIVTVKQTNINSACLLTLTEQGSRQLRGKENCEGAECFMESSKYYTRPSDVELQKMTVQPNYVTKKMQIKKPQHSIDGPNCGNNVQPSQYKFPPNFWLRLSLDPAKQVWGFLLLPDHKNRICKYMSIASYSKVPQLLQEYKDKHVLLVARYARNCDQLLPLLWKANIKKVCFTSKNNYIHFFVIISQPLPEVIDFKTLGQAEFKCIKRLATYGKIKCEQWEDESLTVEKVPGNQ